jgi:hypothetical protein
VGWLKAVFRRHRSGGLWFEANPCKKYVRFGISQWGWVWWCLSSSATQKSVNRIMVQAGPVIKQEPISKITNTKGLAEWFKL